MIAPSPFAQAHQHCAMCRPFDARPDLSHGLCTACERLMTQAADQDADDEQLALLAVRAYGAATYEAAVHASAENYDRKDRAYRRVERLLGKALEQAEKKAGPSEAIARTGGDDAARMRHAVTTT